MPKRLMFALLASLAFVIPAAVMADAGQPPAAEARVLPATPQALPACPQPGDKRLNMAQVGQVQCCKDHKGICGCRAGKIICCDGTASTEPGCTCHGDDGLLQ